jgi:hypothetical protein
LQRLSLGHRKRLVQRLSLRLRYTRRQRHRETLVEWISFGHKKGLTR